MAYAQLRQNTECPQTFSTVHFTKSVGRCFELKTGVPRFPFIIKGIFGQPKPMGKYGKHMWQLILSKSTTVAALCLSFIVRQE